MGDSKRVNKRKVASSNATDSSEPKAKMVRKERTMRSEDPGGSKSDMKAHRKSVSGSSKSQGTPKADGKLQPSCSYTKVRVGADIILSDAIYTSSLGQNSSYISMSMLL